MNETYARIELNAILIFLKRVQMNDGKILNEPDLKFEFINLKHAHTDNQKVQQWIEETYARGGQYAVYAVANNKTFLGSLNFDLTFYDDEFNELNNIDIQTSFNVLKRILFDNLYKNVSLLPNPILVDSKIQFDKNLLVNNTEQATKQLNEYLQRVSNKSLDEVDVEAAKKHAQLIEIMGTNKTEEQYKKAAKLVDILPKNPYSYDISRTYDDKAAKDVLKSAQELKKLGAENINYLDKLIKSSNKHFRENARLKKALKTEHVFATYGLPLYKKDEIAVENNHAYKITKIKPIRMTEEDVNEAEEISNESYAVGHNYQYFGYDVSDTLEGQKAIAEDNEKREINYKTNECNQAYNLINRKYISLKRISELTNIPYSSLRSYVTNSDKLETAAWIRIHKLAVLYQTVVRNLKNAQPVESLLSSLNYESEKDITDLKKAQLLIINRVVSLKQAAQDSGIPYPTLRNFVNKPENMKNAAWIRIHRLADVYDQIIKSL